ncbi:MAG: hypothetical protein ACLFWL_18820 [Candidatus Brocadiia bacterium]
MISATRQAGVGLDMGVDLLRTDTTSTDGSCGTCGSLPGIEYEFRLVIDGGAEGELQPDSRQWYVDRWVRERESDPGDAPTFSEPQKKLCLVLGETGGTFTNAFEKAGGYKLRCRYTHEEQSFNLDVEVEVISVPYIGVAGESASDEIRFVSIIGEGPMDVYIAQYSSNRQEVYSRHLRKVKPKGPHETHAGLQWYSVTWNLKDDARAACSLGISGVTLSRNYAFTVVPSGETSDAWPGPTALPYKSVYLQLPDYSPSLTHEDALGRYRDIPLTDGSPTSDTVVLVPAHGAEEQRPEGTWVITKNVSGQANQEPTAFVLGFRSADGRTVSEAAGTRAEVVVNTEAVFKTGDVAEVEFRCQDPDMGIPVSRSIRLLARGLEWTKVQWIPTDRKGRMAVRYDADNNCLEVYALGIKPYEPCIKTVFNGKLVGICPYQGGTNEVYYTLDENRCYDTVYHRSVDLEPFDEGTKGKLDWVLWYYDCTTDPGEPEGFWREGGQPFEWLREYEFNPDAGEESDAEMDPEFGQDVPSP